MTSSFRRSWLAASHWTPLSKWLAVLAAVASIAALRASLWPLWPRAEPLPQAALARTLQQAGLTATAVPLKEKQAEPHRDHDKAVSQTLAFRFATGEELRLLQGVVRNPLEFDPRTFTIKRKDLFLKNPKQAGPPPQRIGTIAGRPARQTCLVALSPTALGYGVDWSTLGELVNRSAVGRDSVVRRFLGLEANRHYACVLISLRSGGTGPVSPQLWNRLLQTLPQALTPGKATGTAAPAAGFSS
jgi:hypothetical protein